MRVCELLRVEESEEGTIGIWRIDKIMFCVTLEPPDFLNKIKISSIPIGQYICKRYSSEKHPDTFEITNVPGRTKILLHPGNKIKDTEGCVCLAEKQGKLKGDRAVLNSGVTFKNFMHVMRGTPEFSLTITEHY